MKKARKKRNKVESKGDKVESKADVDVKPAGPEAANVSDVVHDARGRWRNRIFFIISASGSAIGVGNIWKFPYLTYKHGGGAFILQYVIALVVCGIPMLVLELTLGQKF